MNKGELYQNRNRRARTKGKYFHLVAKPSTIDTPVVIGGMGTHNTIYSEDNGGVVSTIPQPVTPVPIGQTPPIIKPPLVVLGAGSITSPDPVPPAKTPIPDPTGLGNISTVVTTPTPQSQGSNNPTASESLGSAQIDHISGTHQVDSVIPPVIVPYPGFSVSPDALGTAGPSGGGGSGAGGINPLGKISKLWILLIAAGSIAGGYYLSKKK